MVAEIFLNVIMLAIKSTKELAIRNQEEKERMYIDGKEKSDVL